jgi:hypothetical protein
MSKSKQRDYDQPISGKLALEGRGEVQLSRMRATKANLCPSPFSWQGR